MTLDVYDRISGERFVFLSKHSMAWSFTLAIHIFTYWRYRFHHMLSRKRFIVCKWHLSDLHLGLPHGGSHRHQQPSLSPFNARTLWAKYGSVFMRCWKYSSYLSHASSLVIPSLLWSKGLPKTEPRPQFTSAFRCRRFTMDVAPYEFSIDGEIILVGPAGSLPCSSGHHLHNSEWNLWQGCELTGSE